MNRSTNILAILTLHEMTAYSVNRDELLKLSMLFYTVLVLVVQSSAKDVPDKVVSTPTSGRLTFIISKF